MFAKVESIGLIGLNGFNVTIEVDISNGIPAYETVGLPGVAVKESKDRIRSAIKNSYLDYPTKRITINLAPADRKKEGPVYDLPIALGLLSASGQIARMPNKTVFFGELALDGKIRSVKGLLPMLIEAKKFGFDSAVVPYENISEVECLDILKIYPVKSLNQVVSHLNDKEKIEKLVVKTYEEDVNNLTRNDVDFSEIKGQVFAKKAMEVAAAGGHNILLIGPPGSGKSMLAKSLPGILPDLTFNEALEITQVHSVAGTLDSSGIIRKRPFRSPHHTSSTTAITGGGSVIKPGEISLAHLGVLFLDELPEFKRETLETLRQPLEDGKISIARVKSKVEYPADFMMVAAMNPCPCGNYGSSKKDCRCSPNQIKNYLARISGPLLDRIDLHIELSEVSYDEITSTEEAEDSKSVKERINRAIAIQHERYKGSGIYLNSQANANMVKKYFEIEDAAKKLIEQAFTTMDISARSYTRILKVARTLADLQGAEKIDASHVAGAIQFRTLDRKYWG